mmetsp:Transcript_52710/g.71938  ORF Transcript_52710/g.71938 Transcript_52710/m.71938 type:complete len:88 (-) Transcript_52710:2-265(-)
MLEWEEGGTPGLPKGRRKLVNQSSSFGGVRLLRQCGQVLIRRRGRRKNSKIELLSLLMFCGGAAFLFGHRRVCGKEWIMWIVVRSQE